MGNNKIRYDRDAILAIPILDVCDHLGLSVEKKGRNYWCKVRPESKASVILHTDTNYFYDFGNQEHGNNIDLVQYARGHRRPGEAIRELGKAFHIEASESRQDLLSKPMSAWEYKKIGLYGDMASKNLVFPVATATVDELLDMEYAYRIPMNQLKTEDPAAYRAILLTKAVPFVENKRTRFHLSVWNHYCFLKMFDRQSSFFDSEKTAVKFEDEIRDLGQAERALYKACQGTGLSVKEPARYDPQRVLSHLLQGRTRLSLGTAEPEDLAETSLLENRKLYGKEITYDEYCREDCDNHVHSAIFNAGRIHLTYPDTEKLYFDLAFPAPALEYVPLDSIIAKAEERLVNHNINKEPELVR